MVLDKRKEKFRSTQNGQVCMKGVMNVDEAREACKVICKWHSVVSTYPDGENPTPLFTCFFNMPNNGSGSPMAKIADWRS